MVEDLEVGLLAMADGASAQEAVEQLAALGRPDAQYAGVLANGPPAGWSGPTAAGWAGRLALDDVAVQGNTLVGEQVLQACRDAWLAGPELRLEERLLRALAAGTVAGGDLRGQQSAALLTIESGGKPRSDLRVDNDPTAVRRLEQLLTVARAHDLLQQAWALVPEDLESAAQTLNSALRLAPHDGLLLQTAALVLLHTGADKPPRSAGDGPCPGSPTRQPGSAAGPRCPGPTPRDFGASNRRSRCRARRAT